jgi:hypothetical protein
MARLSIQCHRLMADLQEQTLHTMGPEWILCLGRAPEVTLMNRIQGRTALQQGTHMRPPQVQSLFRFLRSGDLPHSRIFRKIASTACTVSKAVSSTTLISLHVTDRRT